MINKPGKAGYDMGYSKRQGGGYEGRRGHGKGFKRIPVELGEELEVDIKELSSKGDGMARVQGLVIHAPTRSLATTLR